MNEDKNTITTGDGDKINVSKEQPNQVERDRELARKHGTGSDPKSDPGAEPAAPAPAEQ